jgi:hypothetical protein
MAARSTSRTWVEACLSLARRYPDCSFSFDPKAGGEQLLQRLERELPDTYGFVEFPQMTGRLSGASMRFAELVGTRMIRQPDDEELNAHVLTASAKLIGSDGASPVLEESESRSTH